MRFAEQSHPDLLDISSLLYDLELSHDYGVLLSEEEYWGYEFSRYFWYRKGRPIESYHRVKAVKIIKASPLELTLGIASIGALLVVLQIVEKVAYWPLNRKKLKLEMEKLNLEVEKLQGEAAEKKKIDFLQTIAPMQEQRESREGAEVIEERLVKRLAESRLVLLDIEVELVEEKPDDNKHRKG